MRQDEAFKLLEGETPAVEETKNAADLYQRPAAERRRRIIVPSV